MERLLLASVALLALLAIAVPAAAAPAPKTTGDIGYTAYTDVQRHLTFDAIQKEGETCSAFWDVTGVAALDFEYLGGHYIHDVTLTQNGQTNTGVGGGYPVAGPPYSYYWHVTSGSVVGNTFTLHFTYDGAPDALGAVTNMTGTIASDGTISGTWNDNYLGGYRTGTFAASGAAIAATYCAKGSAYYSDASGLWYFVAVKSVSVSGADAWFAGPVILSNFGAEGNWLFAKAHDGGEPAYLVDQVWGSFTDQITAINGVLAHSTPADGSFAITSGNLQVH